MPVWLLLAGWLVVLLVIGRRSGTLRGADAATREHFVELQRASASPELAAALLEAVYRADVRELLPRIAAPTLVLHRRNDRAMPFALGRELAARIPGARLVALEGEADDIHATGLKAAFQKAKDDPLQFAVNREVFKNLERVTDAFEDVANQIDGIVIDHA